MHPHQCMHVHVSADARRGQKRVPEMELQMIVRSLIWLLRTQEISLQVKQVLSTSESFLQTHSSVSFLKKFKHFHTRLKDSGSFHTDTNLIEYHCLQLKISISERKSWISHYRPRFLICYMEVQVILPGAERLRWRYMVLLCFVASIIKCSGNLVYLLSLIPFLFFCHRVWMILWDDHEQSSHVSSVVLFPI